MAGTERARARLAARVDRAAQLIPAGSDADDGPTIRDLLGDYPAALEALARLVDPESSDLDRIDAAEIVYAHLEPSSSIAAHLRSGGRPVPAWPASGHSQAAARPQ